MRKLLITFLLGGLSGLSYGQDSTLRVKVNNINTGDGQIRIALYSSESTFLKKTYRSKNVMAKKGTTHATFSNLPGGTYAISLYHDIDDDGELDRGWFGIPSEPYGFSNNLKNLRGAPSFKQASFSLDQTNNTIEIELFKKSFF